MTPQDFGAKGEGLVDDTVALNAMFREIGKQRTSTPSGTWLGGGLAEIPPGVYRCTGDVEVTPTIYANPSFGASVRGHSATSCVLMFESGGLRAVSYPGGNFSACVHVSDLGIWCKGSDAPGVRYQGAADCTLQRVRLVGWRTGVEMIDVNTMALRDFVIMGAGEFGVALRGECNRVTIDCGQFNGPAINVLHGGGAGQTVRDCNSEGGMLALIRDGHSIVHSGWTTEGMTEDVPALFRFDSQGSPSNAYVANSVEIRDSFFGGRADRPIVLFDETAIVRSLHWHRNHVVRCSPSGVVALPYASHLSGSVVSSGDMPQGVPLFSHAPPQWQNLDKP